MNWNKEKFLEWCESDIPIDNEVEEVEELSIINKSDCFFKNYDFLYNLSNFLILEKLELVNIHLTSLKCIECISTLKYLNVSKNRLISLEGIEKCKNIEELNVSTK
jgi:hypothetical protein